MWQSMQGSDVVSSGQGAIVVLGDGGAVTWQWMGAGDVATCGQGGLLTMGAG